MASLTTIDDFLAQRDLAFVGVSRDTKAFANSVYRALRGAGHAMHPVHPTATEVEGDAAVARLTHLPKAVGGVVVMVRPDDAAGVVREAIAAGIPRIWLHRGAGKGADTPEAVELCHAHGIPVVDGACPMMFLQPVKGVHRLHRAFARRRIAA